MIKRAFSCVYSQFCPITAENPECNFGLKPRTDCDTCFHNEHKDLFEKSAQEFFIQNNSDLKEAMKFFLEKLIEQKMIRPLNKTEKEKIIEIACKTFRD